MIATNIMNNLDFKGMNYLIFLLTKLINFIIKNISVELKKTIRHLNQ